MGKGMKIKRRRNGYRSGRPSPLQVVLAILAAAVLFAAGWFLYQPAYQWIMNLAQPGQENQPPQEEPSVQVQPEEPQQPEEPDPFWQKELQAVWVPAGASGSNAALESYLSTLPGDPVNAVVLELKDRQGSVLYQSKVETALQAGACKEGAIDLAAAVEALHAKDYLVLGRIHAFEDRTATAALPDGKVLYKGTDYTWLDNSAGEGGKPWLNPYSRQAQDYIVALAAEALSMGLDAIVLDGVQFPTGFSLELADYGETEGLSRPQVLSGFVERVEKIVRTHEGIGCWVYMESAELLLPEAMGELGPYGGDAKQMLRDHALMVNVVPASFGIGTEPQPGVTLPANPIRSPGETVAAALSQMGLSMDGALVVPVVQAYTASDIASEFNLAYGEEEVSAQIQAALDYGCRSVVLFDPDGAYSAIK